MIQESLWVAEQHFITQKPRLCPHAVYKMLKLLRNSPNLTLKPCLGAHVVFKMLKHLKELPKFHISQDLLISYPSIALSRSPTVKCTLMQPNLHITKKHSSLYSLSCEALVTRRFKLNM